jgi:hypothetical protein
MRLMNWDQSADASITEVLACTYEATQDDLVERRIGTAYNSRQYCIQCPISSSKAGELGSPALSVGSRLTSKELVQLCQQHQVWIAGCWRRAVRLLDMMFLQHNHRQRLLTMPLHCTPQSAAQYGLTLRSIPANHQNRKGQPSRSKHDGKLLITSPDISARIRDEEASTVQHCALFRSGSQSSHSSPCHGLRDENLHLRTEAIDLFAVSRTHLDGVASMPLTGLSIGVACCR